ncbi:MAG TPA: phosphatase PAP2 family protein [Thiothrix sp.]|nr:phosphatase PAP2 family protein [Thiothrix sp.]
MPLQPLQPLQPEAQSQPLAHVNAVDDKVTDNVNGAPDLITRWLITLPRFVDQHERLLLPTLLLTLMAWVLYATPTVNQAAFLTFNHYAQLLPETIWAHVTMLADTSVALVLAFVFLWQRPQLLRATLIAAVIATFLSHGLKFAFDASRPPAVLPLESFTLIGAAWHGQSFPSGHSVTIATLCGLAALSSQTLRVSMLLFVLALVIASSRIAVGVHWPADVLAGVALGWFCAGLGLSINQRLPALRANIPTYLRWLYGSFIVVLLWQGVKDYPSTAIAVLLLGIWGAVLWLCLVFDGARCQMSLRDE